MGFEEALGFYDQAIAANAGELLYFNNKAAVYMEMGEYQKAIDILKEAVERRYEINNLVSGGASFEKVGKVYVRIATCYSKMNKYDESKEFFDKALTEDNNKNVRNAIREMERERDAWKETQYMDPVKADEHRNKGNEFFKAQKYVEAKAEYDEAIKRNPKDAKVYSNRAAALTKLLAYPDAMRDLDKCLDLDPSFVKAYSRKGTIHFFTKEYNKALEAYEKGLEIDPQNAECQRGKDQVLAKVRENQQMGGQPDQEQIDRAMKDPEIQAILKDARVNQVLKDMQENPEAGMKAITEDPEIGKAIQKLMVSGILSVGGKGAGKGGK